MRESLLAGVRVLIVEDDSLIALDLGDILSAAGAVIVGPFHSVSGALATITQRPPDVAVLDWQLIRETASPVADRLTLLGIPFLFHTSSRREPEVAHPGATIVDKPTRPEQLVKAVALLKGSN